MLVKYPIMGLSYARGYYAICGGGGSLKSGIKNTVDIYQLSDTDPSGFIKDITAETGKELPSGVAFSHNGLLIAVSVNSTCWIYELDKKEKKMDLLVKFRTDFAEEESSQTTACFVGNSTLLTGGEDGVVRVWRLSQDPSALDKASGTSLSLECPEQSDAKPIELPTIGDKVIQGDTMVTLTFEYRGHKKRIKDIHVDPSHRNLVVTSSEDQTCNLWRLTELITIWKFSKDDALDTAYQLLGLKILTGARKHQFRCVRFSNNGRFLYTALTPARGDSVLIKWKPQTIAQEHEEQWQWVVDQAVIAGESPVGSICVSPNDRFICAAAVSGEIKVFLTEDFTPYIRYTNDQHTFAITGMSFSRSNDKQNFYLVSGGADKKILRHLIPLKGGNLSTDGFLVVFINTLKIFVNRLVCFGMSLFLGMTLLFIMLFFLHAKQNLLILDTSPFHGFEDIFELEFLNSFDAQVTFCLTFLCSIVIWFLTIYSNVTNLFFWNGLVCFFSAFIAFFIAISPEMKLTWQTGEKPLDELLDYKISIVLGACCVFFLFCHSFLVMFK